MAQQALGGVLKAWTLDLHSSIAAEPQIRNKKAVLWQFNRAMP